MLIRYNECVILRQIQRPPSYSSHSHSRAANENLPQFVALCKKVHCTLINQNSGPTTTTKRITILRFFITNIEHTHTHIFMASSDASLQTNELYGWCFSYVLHCDAINYSNETRPLPNECILGGSKMLNCNNYVAAGELMSLGDNCSCRRRRMRSKRNKNKFHFRYANSPHLKRRRITK